MNVGPGVPEFVAQGVAAVPGNHQSQIADLTPGISVQTDTRISPSSNKMDEPFHTSQSSAWISVLAVSNPAICSLLTPPKRMACCTWSGGGRICGLKHR
jgi:hypothetical protein